MIAKTVSRSITIGLLTLVVLNGDPARRQPPNADAMPVEVDRGAAGLSRWLKALHTRASILMVTAHPDDEDGGMLAYETRGLGARGILLTLNRGEGGQNAMSPELYDALGLVRTQELLAADRYYGVEQYWTRAIDYGFSKTREEALEKWGHDQVLSDVVRVIRMTRPLVVASVFVGAATDGHGNHQVACQMAQEAFEAAGDPNRFPEQIKEGLRPWRPLKVYARVPFFAITKEGMYDYAIDKYVPVRFYDYVNKTWSSEKPTTTLEIQEGGYAAAAGLTFLQIGREGLGYQKSQNGGQTIPPPGPFASAYHRYGAHIPAAEREESFFDGMDVSVRGIGELTGSVPDFLKAGLDEMSRSIEDASAHFQADRPEAAAPALAEGLQATRALISRVRAGNLADADKESVLFELDVKQNQFEHALAAALSLFLQAAVMPEHEPTGMLRGFAGPTPTFNIAIPGQKFGVRLTLLNSSSAPLQLDSFSLRPSDGKAWQISAVKEPPKTLAPQAQAEVQYALTAPTDAALTRPYFVRTDEEQASYTLTDDKYRNWSLAPYPLSASVEVSFQGVPLHIEQVVQTLDRVPGRGIETYPLLMGPAMSVTLSPGAGAVPLGTKSFPLTCTVHSNVKRQASVALKLRLPSGWKSSPESAPLSMTRDGEDRTVTFTVLPAAMQAGENPITAVAEYQSKTYEEGYKLTGYPGLRPYPFYRPAIYRAVNVDVKTAPGLLVGYLPGTGDDVPTALDNLGVKVRTLSTADIAHSDLAQFSSIILGTRAYAVRQELKAVNNRLLEYVHDGGVLIVQYNLQDFDHNYGPYPFTLGNNPQKVVDENSKVTLLKPESPVFTWPNRITQDDFSHWVEERGHGFLQTWDAQYEPLVETADPEQDPQRGGLLLARYGKGAYIYDAFALYRQLPSGVPGAYRILANLVSLGKNPAW